jgi:tetratricopeptide (TPR) repeat protein
MHSLAAALLALLVSAFSACAQEKPDPKQVADLSLTTVGRQQHPINTKSKVAQEYFNQGITLIYGFNHEQAALAFQKAAELDPASAMPLWGIALAVGPNYNLDVDAEREKLAFETIQKAKTLATRGPQAEQDYVAALATRYSGNANPDYKKLSRDYAMAMKALSEKYPDDLDAATIYAESLMDLHPWKLWTADGNPGEDTREIIRVLESVLTRDPNHAGANHYYIHAVEASPHPDRALMSAERLNTMVPKAGHLVHMPAHIYQRTGDYQSALRSNEEAVKVDREYVEKAKQTGSIYDLMYHSHNEHFAAMAASMAGNYSAAKKYAEGMKERLLPHAAAMPMLDAFIMTPIWVDVRFSKWNEILARPEPAKALAGTHAMWRYSRAVAFAQQNKVADAEREKDLFAKEIAVFPPDAMLGVQNKASDVLGIAMHVVEARIAAAKSQNEEAMAHWQKAVALQDKLNYDEPADWYYPVRESLGGALLKAGKGPEAEQVFRADLVDYPRNPRSLFGLKEALRAQGKESDALWIERSYESAWSNADTKLSVADL